ncbi:MAG: TIGR00730 family Rossman fold protein [Bacteroidia bacterium]|nr:TIGR00730 family Rossman fold protein [Bacteroidia bacterium]
MKSVCVFCGSQRGHDPVYAAAARETGETLARQGITLVYGGGSVGLMGIVADAALEAGGTVVGVIPDFLDKLEAGHNGLTEKIIVETMHQRKALMASRSEGFIALPGGLGTMDELFEILTWAQLGLHTHPIGLLNVAGYYDALLALLDSMRDTRFVSPRNRNLLLADTDLTQLLGLMKSSQSAPDDKLLDYNKL